MRRNPVGQKYSGSIVYNGLNSGQVFLRAGSTKGARLVETRPLPFTFFWILPLLQDQDENDDDQNDNEQSATDIHECLPSESKSLSSQYLKQHSCHSQA